MQGTCFSTNPAGADLGSCAGRRPGHRMCRVQSGVHAIVSRCTTPLVDKAGNEARAEKIILRQGPACPGRFIRQAGLLF